MATKTRKGKRRSTGKQPRPTGSKPTSRARAKLARSKRTKLAGAVRPGTPISRLRSGRLVTRKRGPTPRFQRRRVVIRFRDGFDETRERRELRVRYGETVLRPVFVAARAAIERLWIRIRKRNPESSLPNFRNYYFLYLRPGLNPARVAQNLRERSSVAFAYEDAPTEPALVAHSHRLPGAFLRVLPGAPPRTPLFERHRNAHVRPSVRPHRLHRVPASSRMRSHSPTDDGRGEALTRYQTTGSNVSACLRTP